MQESLEEPHGNYELNPAILNTVLAGALSIYIWDTVIYVILY